MWCEKSPIEAFSILVDGVAFVDCSFRLTEYSSGSKRKGAISESQQSFEIGIVAVEKSKIIGYNANPH